MRRGRHTGAMVTVLYFAACRERAGTEREALELGGKRVADALEALKARHPSLGEVLPYCRFAVDQAFTDPEHVLEDGQELALIPPVAGGHSAPGSSAPVRARVLETPLSVDEVLERIHHPGCGAEVVMIGTVRDRAAGAVVESLRYEAYAAMAEKIIDGIVREVEAEHEGVRGAVDHRIGHLAIGDRAVVVAASSPHRAEAFAACQRIIDRLKEDAPIWKHEHREGGVVWVGLGP